MTVETGDVHDLRCSDTVTAARTLVFSAVAVRVCADDRGQSAVVGVRAGEGYGRKVAVHFDLSELIVIAHPVEKALTWFGMTPSVFFGAGDDQTALFCFVFEAFVVIRSVSGSVLYVGYAVVVHVDTFVNQGTIGTDLHVRSTFAEFHQLNSGRFVHPETLADSR